MLGDIVFGVVFTAVALFVVAVVVVLVMTLWVDRRKR